MVGIVQLAEHRIVVPGVVGSSPITHPIKTEDTKRYPLFLYGYLWVMGLERPLRKQSGGLFLGRGRVPHAARCVFWSPLLFLCVGGTRIIMHFHRLSEIYNLSSVHLPGLPSI